MSDPLIAVPVTGTSSPWAGVWIAEDVELIADGVRSGSWIDASIGAVSAGLDALALVMDPIGGLLQYGIAWLIEHVRPLTEALDWLAGDGAQIAAHAQTWRNVSGKLDEQAEALQRSVRRDLSAWTGAAADAYSAGTVNRAHSLRTLSKASETMALAVEGAGVLVGTVRMMVRDAVATVVSRLIVYAGEIVATAGLATPVVAAQVSALCAAWGAKIARWLRGLIASLRRLGESMARLGRNMDDLNGIGKGTGEPGRKPDGKSAQEEERLRALGMDPAVGKLRVEEMETAQRIEHQLGIELRRSTDPRVDWVDAEGKTYDSLGNFAARHFDSQWENLQMKIMDHLEKADVVPVDVAQFTPDHVAKIERFIADNALGPRCFIVGR